ncbi:MAG: GTPase [Polyangiales bacterium]
MGAAGRDFHDLLTFFREHPEMRVRCFTAHQIPFIDERVFPAELAPEGYDEDIPIHPEQELPDLVRRYGVSLVFLAYSDLSHDDVMHKASIVQSAGASFVLLGPAQTQLVSRLPVLSVTAVRTGAGKSPLSQAIAADLVSRGRRVAVLRHPMPYGDLRKQAVQRFATAADLDRHECTVEEREEYEPYLERGTTVWAGVDYRRILEQAEQESDVVLWDGGNNDTPFVRPDVGIVVADALRPGHETSYYPGETGFRSAEIIVINKVGAADRGDVDAIRRRAGELVPDAIVVEADLRIGIDDVEAVRGKRVLVVEDGPTLTHGGMAYGAGTLAAREHELEVVDPRPHAVGSIAKAFAQYPHLGPVLPALGYSAAQRRELAETIRAAAPDVVLDASPASIDRLLELELPVVRVRYAFEQRAGPDLLELVAARLGPAPG